MKSILKPIFDFIVDQYTIFENPLWNWLIFLVIGVIGYIVAFRFVGRLYDSGEISGRTVGSIIHWIVRLIVVALIAAICSVIIWVIRFIISYWLYILIATIVIVAIIIGVCLYRSKTDA